MQCYGPCIVASGALVRHTANERRCQGLFTLKDVTTVWYGCLELSMDNKGWICDWFGKEPVYSILCVELCQAGRLLLVCARNTAYVW